MSLIAYSSSLASPLDRLSTDAADQQAFFDLGWQLVDDIADGNVPLRRHRLRLLIYPGWAYDTFSNEVSHLIRSHSAARIPCIPLITEQLYENLDANDRQQVADLVDKLDQSLVDKLPALSRYSRWRLTRKLNKSADRNVEVFPDMLLIDSAESIATTAVWWYSSDGHVHNWKQTSPDRLTEANAAFRAICRAARDAAWPNYAPGSVGGVITVLGRSTLDSEAFFARRHYDDWLAWIRDRSSNVNSSASKLSAWLGAEDKTIDGFLNDYLQKNPARQKSLRILDLGCGFGRHLTEILRNHGDIIGLGVDINARMVSEATRRAKRAHVSNRVDFIVGDVSTLEDCEDEEFDVAICMTNTLGNLPPAKQVHLMQRLCRVLLPG